MKRLLALLLSATMVLGFTGCGASSTGDTAKSDGKVSEVTIGTTSWPTNMFFYLANEKGFFDKEGVKVKIQDFSSTTESTNAFVAGQCDAACIWDPYFSQAIASGGTKLYSSSDNPNLITDVLCTSNKLCEENPDVVEAVVRGFFDAVEYWKSNPDEANKFMGDKLGVGEEEFKKEIEGLIITDPSSVKTAFTPAEDYSYWGYTQNTIRDFMYELGVLKNKDKDCGDMINNTFVEKIAAEK